MIICFRLCKMKNTPQRYRMIGLAFLILVTTLLTNGCCTIIHGTSQKIYVDSRPQKAAVSVNGHQIGQTPITLNLKRSGFLVPVTERDYRIHIELEDYHTYEIALTWELSGWLWGNFVFPLGSLTLVVDALDGAIYKLTPNEVLATLYKKDH